MTPKQIATIPLYFLIGVVHLILFVMQWAAEKTDDAVFRLEDYLRDWEKDNGPR